MAFHFITWIICVMCCAFSCRFLRYLRSAKSGENMCFVGQCRAEMKKSVSYIVHLLQDPEGDVLESQCECAAGMGPKAHCKHIQVVLLGLVDISEGKVPLLELSCTDVIQTFHRPTKIHRGSPVKARDLRLKQGSDMFFDPRPQELRGVKSYPDFVKNAVVNFCSNNKSNMPLLQTTQPVNMLAFDHDHHYFKDSPSTQFLKRMKVAVITPEQGDEIEESTVGHGSTWKEERLNRLQSSIFGKILSTVSAQAK